MRGHGKNRRLFLALCCSDDRIICIYSQSFSVVKKVALGNSLDRTSIYLFIDE